LVYLRYLSASSIDVFVRAYIDAATFKDELAYRQELIFTIMEKVKENGLSFAFPSQSLYIETISEKRVE
jgi:MscS family membrane protein